MKTVRGELRGLVLSRDRYCVARRYDDSSFCRDSFGNIIVPSATWLLELDHIREEPMMGKAAPTDEAHLVALCPGHHRGVGHERGAVWATAHRPELRRYLAALYPEVWREWSARRS